MTLNAHRTRDQRRVRRLRCVLLNGHQCPDAFYADGRRGVVREYVRVDGKLQLTPDRTEILKRELRGRVTWVWR